MSKEKKISPHTVTMTQEEPLLSPQRAFVLQFHPGTNIADGCFSGRVEHVQSGKAIGFDSLDGILTFLDNVLVEVTKNSPGNKLGHSES